MKPRKAQVGKTAGWGPFKVSADRAESHLEELRERHAAGDSVALLEAAEYCLYNRAPHWVVRGFAENLGRWQALLVPSLDKAFGVPKITYRKAKFERQQLMFEVYRALQAAKRLGIGKSEWVFEVLGEELEISTGRVKEYNVAARAALNAQFERQKRRDPKATLFAQTYSTSVRLQERLERRLVAELENRRQKT
jgi:hypothetical protein